MIIFKLNADISILKYRFNKDTIDEMLKFDFSEMNIEFIKNNIDYLYRNVDDNIIDHFIKK